MKLVDARKVLSTYNDNNEDEELVYELEKYNDPKPKTLQTIFVTDEEHPNLKVPIRKKI